MIVSETNTHTIKRLHRGLYQITVNLPHVYGRKDKFLIRWHRGNKQTATQLAQTLVGTHA